jgi:hypothetical protein
MGKVKTASDYEAEIRKLYPEVQLLKNHCEADPDDKDTLKDFEKSKNTLRWYRDQWAARIPITVYVANNEQLPNSSAELRCNTEPMPQYHKKKWPYYQTGDYQAYIPDLKVWYPILRERKSINDLHGTLVDKDHRKNLFEEYERFLVDPRFTVFRFDLECYEEEFYNYLPPVQKKCQFCEVKRTKMDSGDYFCPRTNEFFPTFDSATDFYCHEGFKEREKDPIDKARLRSLKKKIIDQCFEMGMQIKWRGSRKAAYEAYRPNIETWLKLNYVKLLKLDNGPYNDQAALLKRKAELEASLTAVNHSLEMMGVTV